MFSKFLFFSFVFFIISFFVNTVIVFAAADDPEKTIIKKDLLKDCTDHIHIQQKQIIEQLENVERKL